MINDPVKLSYRFFKFGENSLKAIHNKLSEHPKVLNAATSSQSKSIVIARLGRSRNLERSH